MSKLNLTINANNKQCMFVLFIEIKFNLRDLYLRRLATAPTWAAVPLKNARAIFASKSNITIEYMWLVGWFYIIVRNLCSVF